jgi:hypothetical protein
MASTHSYFHSNDTDKQTLHRRIIPNELQQSTQQERWNDLCDFLVSELSDDTDLEITSWLQGSYKFGTQTRPVKRGDEFDIDLGIYFNWDGPRDSGVYSADQIRDLVQKCLIKYSSEVGDDTKALIPPKDRCLRIHFSGDFHVDVPTYHLDKITDIRSLAVTGDEWEESDPKAFYLWFQSLTEEPKSAQLKRLIRYFKIWSALHLEKGPSSILITVLVAEIYIQLSESELNGDDLALKNIAEKIYERLSNSLVVRNPVDETENLNRLSEEENTIFLNKLNELITKANEALSSDSEITSVSAWSEIFLHLFPAPIIDQSKTNNKAIIAVQFEPRVHITATPVKNANKIYQGINSIGPIPRDCNLKFHLTNAESLPANAKVQWMVRNEGEEAEYVNDLGHIAGNDNFARHEHSAYKGTHFMDIIVTQPFRGVIGFQRIPVTISGMFMPPRNPRKPGYTRIPKKR